MTTTLRKGMRKALTRGRHSYIKVFENRDARIGDDDTEKAMKK